jgi:hypothetical protein
MSSSAITGPIFSDNKRAPAGTAAAPSFAFNDSTGTGVYLVSPGVLGLSTAGVQRVVVDASGNVGIGTASPSSFTGYTTVSVNNATNGGIYNILVNGIETARLQAFSGTFNVAAKGASTNLTFETNGAERMRITSDGKLLIGASTVTGNNERLRVNGAITVDGIGIHFTGASLIGSGNAMGLRWNSPDIYGTVDNVVSAVLGTASDYRLKTNIKPVDSCLSKVLELKPVTFNAKDFDGTVKEEEKIGFIAHEIQEVFPQMATLHKDAKDENGNNQYQSVNYAGLTPVLVKAIQEQQEIIGKLEARLAALESK